MSFTFDPYNASSKTVSVADDVLMTNPTALQELETYWRSLPRTCGIPNRKDVDPLALGPLLEDSFILERVAPGVARIRVAGRSIGKLIGLEPRGLPMTSLVATESRSAISTYLEKAFSGPNLVELSLVSPRAVGQPKLQGKILFLPLLDDDRKVSRVLGILAMSGRRGIGTRRLSVVDETPRVEPIVGLKLVKTSGPFASHRFASKASMSEMNKAKDRPALRLVVSNH